MTLDHRSGPTEIDEQYLDELRGYRKDLLTIQKEQIGSYDKAILSLSGGGIGISIAFADKFSDGVPEVSNWLLCAWIAFGLAIALNVGSYLTSSHDIEIEIQKVRQSVQAGGTDIRSGNPWRNITVGLNAMSLVAFVFGVGLFGLHAYSAA